MGDYRSGPTIGGVPIQGGILRSDELIRWADALRRRAKKATGREREELKQAATRYLQQAEALRRGGR